MLIPRNSGEIFSPVDDPRGIIASVREHGVAIVRGVFPRPQMAELRAAIDEFLADFEGRVEAGKLERERLDWIVDHGLSGASLPAHFAAVLRVVSSGIARRCAQLFLNDADIVVPNNHVLFRCRNEFSVRRAIDIYKMSHGFHQDYTLVPTCFPMNMWLALTDVGDESTGVSFVFPPTSEVQPFPFDIETYIAKANGAVWSPHYCAGDLAIFPTAPSTAPT